MYPKPQQIGSHKMQEIKELSITDQMRKTFVPSGTAPIVQLSLSEYGLANSDFVLKCIEELEHLPLRTQLGNPPTNLEKLAYRLLCDSAFINITK